MILPKVDIFAKGKVKPNMPPFIRSITSRCMKYTGKTNPDKKVTGFASFADMRIFPISINAAIEAIITLGLKYSNAVSTGVGDLEFKYQLAKKVVTLAKTKIIPLYQVESFFTASECAR